MHHYFARQKLTSQLALQVEKADFDSNFFKEDNTAEQIIVLFPFLDNFGDNFQEKYWCQTHFGQH